MRESTVLSHSMSDYHNLHYALRRARGKASEYPCAGEGCEKQATEWAWDHVGPFVEEEVLSFGMMRRVKFSRDFDRYLPLCKSCHVRLDLQTDPTKFPCGHPRTTENTYTRPSANSSYCRTCHRTRERERRA